MFLVSQSSISGSDDGLLQQQVDEAGLGCSTGVGPGGGEKSWVLFCFPFKELGGGSGVHIVWKGVKGASDFFVFFGLNIHQLLYVDVETERMKENWKCQCVLIEFLVVVPFFARVFFHGI